MVVDARLNLRLNNAMSSAYMLTAYYLGAEAVTLFLMTALTSLCYGVFVFLVTPVLLSSNEAGVGPALSYQVGNVAAFFMIAVGLSFAGFDADTIGISTAVLWHLQLISLIDLTKGIHNRK